MNDNQYICHSSEIICHAGKKGMKWGQGPYSKLKGYVKKTYDDYLNNKSKLDIGQPKTVAVTDYDGRKAVASSKYDFNSAWAANKAHQRGYNRTKKERGDKWLVDFTDPDDLYNSINRTAISGVNRTNALKFQQAKKNAEKTQKDGMKRTKKENKRKLYRVVKSKVYQIFGKPTMTIDYPHDANYKKKNKPKTFTYG